MTKEELTMKALISPKREILVICEDEDVIEHLKKFGINDVMSVFIEKHPDELSEIQQKELDAMSSQSEIIFYFGKNFKDGLAQTFQTPLFCKVGELR